MKYSIKPVRFLCILLIVLISACSKGDLSGTPDQRPNIVSAVPGPGAGQITVTWDPPQVSPTSYTLYSHPIKSGATTTTHSNVTSPCVFSIHSPDITIIHEFRITAVYGVNEFASEALTSVAKQRTVNAVLVPQNFTAIPGSEVSRITISWDLVANNPRYELYTHASTWPGGTVSVLQDATPPVTYSALHTDLASTHEFYVKAIAGDSEGISGTIVAVPR